MTDAETRPAKRLVQIVSHLLSDIRPQKHTEAPILSATIADPKDVTRPLAVDGSQMDDFQWEQDIKLGRIFDKINKGEGPPIDTLDPIDRAVLDLRMSASEKK